MIDGPNMYAYVTNDPINYIDPMGTTILPMNDPGILEGDTTIPDPVGDVFDTPSGSPEMDNIVMSDPGPINSGQSGGDCELNELVDNNETQKGKNNDKSKSGLHTYMSGSWNHDTNIKADLGQAVYIKVRNVNVLGTTISISSSLGDVQEAVLLPYKEYAFRFATFVEEPFPWEFDISTSSDAFIVNYTIESTWVPGMPPNR